MKTRLRELAPAARGSQDKGSRNLVFTFQPSTVQRDTNLENKSQDGLNFLPIPSVDVELETISEKKRNGAAAAASAAAAMALTPVSS